jgi:hypothetical protein
MLVGRQRKIRCVFRPNNTTTCISCFAHGVCCVNQTGVSVAPPSNNPRMNLSERVAQLEQQLSSMHPSTEALPPPSPFGIAALHSLPTLPSTPSTLPALALFDNTVLSLQEKNIFNYSIQKEFNGEYSLPVNMENSPHFQKSRVKRAEVCEALTALLPSHTTMYEILETSGIWWDILRKMHPHMCSEDPNMTIQTYVFLGLNQDNPAVIGCALSWLALSIHCLPCDFESNHLGLPLPVNDLTDHYLSSIDRLIVSDDELSISLEGIECILLQAQLYGFIGRPRKAWITIRRGISHAILLGITTSPPKPMSTYMERRWSVWWHLMECDAYLSLLLGLPSFHSTASWNSPADNAPGGYPSTSCYRRKLSIIAGKISQRNLELPTLLSKTKDLHNELEQLSSTMSDAWWKLAAPLGSGKQDGIELHERLSTQFSYYQAKVYLHLPLMVQLPTDTRFDHSRIQCFTASRKMIQIYQKIVTLAGSRIDMCRIIHFQAFTAAVVLLLGLLGYRRKELEDTSQDMKDWDLIYSTMSALSERKCGGENLTAVQCLQALETLVILGRAGASKSSRYRIFIPYFGMISITPGSNYSRATIPPDPAQDAENMTDRVDGPPVSSEVESPTIEIDVFNAPFLGSPWPTLNQVSHRAATRGVLFQDTLEMDIDQDWSWMLTQNF